MLIPISYNYVVLKINRRRSGRGEENDEEKKQLLVLQINSESNLILIALFEAITIVKNNKIIIIY